MKDQASSTLELASQILIAALSSKTLAMLPDPRVRQSTPEHDASQIARAFAIIHESVHNEFQRINGER